MQTPKSYEELASLIEENGKKVLFFTADWCPDCQYIYLALPEIEEQYKDLTFIRVDRDDYMAIAQKWDIFGIPSFVVIEDGKELGRFVSKLRKTKSEITAFLDQF
ncbi:hypothetical protein HMPREF9318_01700 [Streptococcus urinalis FB127-CNA-2]|uniref:Hydrogenase-1 expression protein HyaE n=1 Tax=Streptococcus urinalis 2285-97 TaxID=764291 RepID=G5KES3_9STRE|nr:thioredoxin family protein [Streptococcus urinalis]EHJ56947.1 hydrogenase-1 expression protein HyaE [Streptococcus urinalis 2285-97]EKS18201.1 hypothetical protein HMPREF9318_01700 [Streptococcus urinalis FB127-CNA-2]VEF32974.1 thioredoxin [Streptococcus urinalis]